MTDDEATLKREARRKGRDTLLGVPAVNEALDFGELRLPPAIRFR